MKMCYGFGEFEHKCTNKPEKKSKLSAGIWCKRCDDLRHRHITKQLELLVEGFKNE